MWWIFLAAGLVAGFLWGKFWSSDRPAEKGVLPVHPKGHEPSDVGRFYDTYNDQFLKVYGEVIQAFRTRDVHKLLDYQMESMGLEKGQRLLDAGCGVCGPAIYFAREAGVNIDAVTVSPVQVEQARKRIEAAGMSGQVKVHQGDYHRLPERFPTDHYDLVYFLESFGHARDHAEVLESAWKVIKPGGTLYIKDLFRKVAFFPELQSRIDGEIAKINQAYRYNIADLYGVLDAARRLGFVIMNLKTIDLKLEDFENLTISNDFQELTGIGKIDNWKEYIFPVEFYELKCYKPVYNIENGLGKYFLQNLYNMQVRGLTESDLNFARD